MEEQRTDLTAFTERITTLRQQINVEWYLLHHV